MLGQGNGTRRGPRKRIGALALASTAPVAAQGNPGTGQPGVEMLEPTTEQPAAGVPGDPPFFLFGADNDPPADEDVLDPPPCGYVIDAAQAQQIETPAELFGLVTEQVTDDRVFVTMAQPMMTVVPLLLDPDARANLVAGTALYDPAECADP